MAGKQQPSADHGGFTDALGRHLPYEAGVRAAARCIVDQGEMWVVEELIRQAWGPDEVLVWIVYPDTGLFADEIEVRHHATAP